MWTYKTYKIAKLLGLIKTWLLAALSVPGQIQRGVRSPGKSQVAAVYRFPQKYLYGPHLDKRTEPLGRSGQPSVRCKE